VGTLNTRQTGKVTERVGTCYYQHVVHTEETQMKSHIFQGDVSQKVKCFQEQSLNNRCTVEKGHDFGNVT
jgi:hypothetical protein